MLWLARKGAEVQGRFAQDLRRSGVSCWDETEAGRLWEGGRRAVALGLREGKAARDFCQPSPPPRVAEKGGNN